MFMLKFKSLFAFLLVLVMIFGICVTGTAVADDSVDAETKAAAESYADEVFHIICDVSPVNIAYAKNVKCDVTNEDVWRFSFDSFYGHFSYVIDAVTKKVTEREEPDIEAVRAEEGFREPMDYDDLLGKIFDQAPIDITQTRGIRCSLNPDDTCAISFDSAYGPFVYLVDPFTGEILEREEPDIMAALADPDFQERIDTEELLSCIFDICPIDITVARNIKPSLRADDRWLVTFGSAYGDFMYLVDPYGEILEKTEPDIEAAKAQEGFREPLDTEGILNSVFDNCPIDITLARKIKPSPGKNDTWTVTFESDYGDFMYVVDAFTGEILERSEPDMEAVKAEEGFTEPLAVTDIMNNVFAVAPIRVDQMQDIRPSMRADGTWAVTFDSDYGSFLYVVDGTTGEILEKTEPEIG